MLMAAEESEEPWRSWHVCKRAFRRPQCSLWAVTCWSCVVCIEALLLLLASAASIPVGRFFCS
jgi:hypothetical protein